MPIADVRVIAKIRGAQGARATIDKHIKQLAGPPFLQTMRMAVLIVRREAQRLVPVHTGRLRASIREEIRKRRNVIFGVVGSNVKYAPDVEFGTPPHKSNFATLLRWVSLKGVAGTYSTSTKRRLGSKAIRKAQDERAAWAIWHHIRKHGTKAQPYLEPALRNKARWVYQYINDAVAKMITKG